MIQARRIGHATFETPDLDRAIDYYTQVNGLVLAEREENRAFLASKIGQLVVRLDRGASAQCTGLSFEVGPNSDFADMCRQLSDQGIANELSNDSIPGIGANRRRALLTTFGSLAGVRRATREELASVVGAKAAAAVIDHFARTA